MTKMYNYALFVEIEKKRGMRKLSTLHMAIAENDAKGFESAVKTLRKSAAMWRANYEPYINATFAICRSPHGEDNFKEVLLKV